MRLAREYAVLKLNVGVCGPDRSTNGNPGVERMTAGE